jgi:hypothetical protein
MTVNEKKMTFLITGKDARTPTHSFILKMEVAGFSET